VKTAAERPTQRDGFDGRAIANYILDYCDNKGRPVTHLTLQKIIYFCHVASLVELRRPLIKHNFEAWEYGPVLQYVYREFKANDREPIKDRALALDPITGKRMRAFCAFDDETKKLIDGVIDFHSRLSPGYLVELTHAVGGPWHKTWNHAGKVNPGMKIDNADIYAFYSQPTPRREIQ